MLFLLDAFTRLLNRLFAAPVDALLATLGVHPVYPTHPISNALALELVVMIGLIAFSPSAAPASTLRSRAPSSCWPR